MQELGRTLLVVGTLVAALGLVVLLAAKLGLGHLPGDVVIRSRHVTLFVPIVTSILLSLLLTVLFWLIGGRRN